MKQRSQLAVQQVRSLITTLSTSFAVSQDSDTYRSLSQWLLGLLRELPHAIV